MSWIERLWSWVKGLFRRGPAPLTTIRVEEPPEALRPRTVYLLGEGEHVWSVAMLCPCGCGEQIQLSTVGGRPRWVRGNRERWVGHAETFRLEEGRLPKPLLPAEWPGAVVPWQCRAELGAHTFPGPAG